MARAARPRGRRAAVHPDRTRPGTARPCTARSASGTPGWPAPRGAGPGPGPQPRCCPGSPSARGGPARARDRGPRRPPGRAGGRGTPPRPPATAARRTPARRIARPAQSRPLTALPGRARASPGESGGTAGCPPRRDTARGTWEREACRGLPTRRARWSPTTASSSQLSHARVTTSTNSCARVPIAMPGMRGLTEIRRCQRRAGSDDVPAGPACAEVIQRREPAGEFPRLAVGRRAGSDQGEVLAEPVQGGSAGRVEALDVGVEMGAGIRTSFLAGMSSSGVICRKHAIQGQRMIRARPGTKI
jgi:hypothetical protein